MPYFSTEVPTYVIYTYDELNRVITTQSPAPNNEVAVTTTVYDASIGRFLNADPYIQEKYNT